MNSIEEAQEVVSDVFHRFISRYAKVYDKYGKKISLADYRKDLDKYNSLDKTLVSSVRQELDLLFKGKYPDKSQVTEKLPEIAAKFNCSLDDVTLIEKFY